MKSNMKKFLALFLSLSLVLAMFGDFAQVKAADSYTPVTLTETDGWSTSYDGENNRWVLYLKTNGYTSADWSCKYEGFTIEYNGAKAKTDQVSSADGNRLYCTIPSNLVPAKDGVVFTIKAGQYEPEPGTSAGLNILNDFTVVAVDGRLVGTKVIEPIAVEAFNGNANSFYFSLKDANGNVLDTGVSSWVQFLSPSYCDGTRIDTAGWTTTYSGVRVDGAVIDYWGAHFKNTDPGIFYIDGLNASEGTTVTVRGHFVSSTQQGNWTAVGNFYLPELTFRYDGSAWNYIPSYAEVTLTGTDGWSTCVDNDNSCWKLYMTTSGYSSIDWTKKYAKFTYEINGVPGETSEVSSADGNRLYCTIPISEIPADSGTTFTIKAGDYAPVKDYRGLRITEDLDIVTIDNHLVSTKVIEPFAVETGSSTANSFHFYLKDANENGISTGLETWDNFLSPSYCDGTRVAEGDWSTTYSGVRVDGTPINYWKTEESPHFKNTGVGEFYIDGLSATKGTTVTVKGHFVSSTQADWITMGNFYLPELTFTYDGSTWSYVNESEPAYKEYTGTPELQEWNGVKGCYFLGNEPEGTTEFPYDTGWNIWAHAVDEEESGVFLNGEKTTAYLKKVDSDRWYVELEAANVAPEDGDEITIAGTFVYTDTDGVNHRIKFNEETFIYETPEAPGTYQGTPVLHEQDAYGKASGFYFSAGDCVPKRGWNEDLAFTAQNAETDGVFIKTGTETTKYSEIHLQKVEADIWYIKLSAASNLSLSRGDVVIIKGKFASSDGTEVTFTEAKFQFDGKHFGQGEFIDGVVDFTITDLYYNNIVYDETNKCWNIYVTPNSNTLPGEAGSTYYPYMTCVIDGEEYDSYWHKTTTTRTINGVAYNNILIQISADALPKDLVAEHTIIFKARTAQRRTSRTNVAHADGVRLAEDFPIIVGDCYEASAPAVDYGNTGGSGGDTTALWLTSNDDFPIVDTSWTHQIKKVGTGNGVYVYNDSEDKFEETNVIMKQHQDNQYYVSLKEGNVTVEDGTVIMLKGTFSTGGLHFVTFNAAKYKYSSGKWEVYTEVNEVTGTGIDGDATGTDGLNSVDLVRMKKYLVELSTEMNYADADLNVSGKIDENDIAIERKLLVGLVLYKGAPTYENTEEAKMRLAAYVAPELSDGPAAFDTYAKAGFTTIIGEKTAVYDDADDVENLNQYMTYAANAELDVLIQAGSIQNMAEGNIEYNQTLLENDYNAVSGYDNFRGLFMGDEPGASEEDSYKLVTEAIRQLAGTKEIDLFLSCHPVYTEEAIYEDSTGNMSDIEKYANYVDVWGRTFDEFTYDFYPFRNKMKKEWSWDSWSYEEVTTSNMRDQWFTNLNLAALRAKNSYETEHFETGFTVQSYAEKANEYDYYRTVSQADISYQVYSALAFGVKSINYFTYGVHWSIPETTNCMVDANGNTTDIYDSVKNVNSIIQKIDNVLLNYNWDGTIAIEGEDSDGIIKNMNGSFEVYESNRISSYSSKKVVNGVTIDTNADAIIGCLKDTNGYDGFMIVNATDPIDSITNEVSVTFKEKLADGTEVVSTHATVYENGEMITKPLDNGTFTATLSPGQGIFVIPYIQ